MTHPNSSCCPGRLVRPISRRAMLAASANGFGALALAGLLADEAKAAPSEKGLPQPHFAPRARNVIFLFMDGGVSHVDSFDPKAELDKQDGKAFTESKNPTANGNRQWLKSPWKFEQRGQCGMPRDTTTVSPYHHVCHSSFP